MTAPQGSNVHLSFHADELAYLRARAAADDRSVAWVVRRLVREAMRQGKVLAVIPNQPEEGRDIVIYEGTP